MTSLPRTIAPATRLQYLLGSKAPLAARAGFVSTQLKERASFLSSALTTLLSEPAVHKPAFRPLHEAIQEIRDARSGSEAARLATNIWAAANPTLEMLQPLFWQSYRRQSSAASFDASKHALLLDWLQYNLIGLRTLAGSISAADLAKAETITAQGGQAVSPAVSCDSGFSVAVEKVDVGDAVLASLSNVSALAVDKFGVAPPVAFSGGKLLTHDQPGVDPSSYNFGSVDHAFPAIVGVRSYVAFAVSELLKNAFGSVVTRYGASRVDDAPPIEVRIAETTSTSGSFVTISVSDKGSGSHLFTGVARDEDFSYFPLPPASTSSAEPNYTYSREHGPTISGKGLGLVRASLYCRYHGGQLCALSQPGVGYTAMMVLEKTGGAGAGDFLALPPALTSQLR